MFTTWMDPQGMMPTEMSDRKRQKPYDSTYMQNVNKGKLTEIAQSSSLQGSGDKASQIPRDRAWAAAIPGP